MQSLRNNPLAENLQLNTLSNGENVKVCKREIINVHGLQQSRLRINGTASKALEQLCRKLMGGENMVTHETVSTKLVLRPRDEY